MTLTDVELPDIAKGSNTLYSRV